MNAKKPLSILMTICMTLGLLSWNVMPAWADSDYLEADAYANQWGRSDVRAWLNGLTKSEGTLPIDGSNGAKSSSNFLNYFTDAELALIAPQHVTTVMFNDDSGTTSRVVTEDRFWLPSGNWSDGFDKLISADPSYDLSEDITYTQKIENGEQSAWKNVIPLPFWGAAGSYGWLRSADKENGDKALSADVGYEVSQGDVNDSSSYYSYPCTSIRLPNTCFAACVPAYASTWSDFTPVNIAGYDDLGKSSGNTSNNIPSWGMCLKKISLDNISVNLNYDQSENKLIFTSPNPLPEGKYLVVQAYKNWDSDKTPTENAKTGESVYFAYLEIPGDSITSVGFENATGFTSYTVKVWVETPATTTSLAQASTPLTFEIDNNGTVTPKTEVTSGNPRVFAYKDDINCSWGTLNAGALTGNNNGLYVGTGATWQKLYFGTVNSVPIEWWITSNSNGILTLYQANGETGYHEFNSSTENYEDVDNIKNPSLLLADVNAADLSDIATKVVLKDSEGNILTPSAGKFSVEYCNADTGIEWTSTQTGAGDYFVRVAFAGEEIGGVSYAPCYSNIQSVTVKDLTTDMVTLSVIEFTYNGSAHEPTVIATDSGVALTKDTDFTVRYGDNTNVGTATVTVSGIGAYVGTVTLTFRINEDESTANEPTGGETPSGSTSSSTRRTHSGNESQSNVPSAATTVSADGTKSSVVSDENGNMISAEVQISENAAQSGKTVTLPLKVKAAGDLSSAVPIDVKVPETVSAKKSVKIEVPVENISPGIVPMIMKDESTAEIIKTSTISENGVVMALKENATIKLVDNTKSFSDVKSKDWFVDNVAWASSREIMNGVGGEKFSPNSDTTQGMMEQILFNLDGNELVTPGEGEPWWNAADSWAEMLGLTTGLADAHDPSAPATREVDILMMYNYAKAKGYDVSARADLSRFSDASSVSDYAREAIEWAVGVGLINGTVDKNGNVILDANGVASRAQVSAIAQRFCEKVLR